MLGHLLPRVITVGFLVFALWQVPPAGARLWRLSAAAPLEDRWSALTSTPEARLRNGIGTLHEPMRAVLAHVPSEGSVVCRLRTPEITPEFMLRVDAEFRHPLLSLIAPRKLLLLLTAEHQAVRIPLDFETYIGPGPFHLLELETFGAHPWDGNARIVEEGEGFRLWEVRSL